MDLRHFRRRGIHLYPTTSATHLCFQGVFTKATITKANDMDETQKPEGLVPPDHELYLRVPMAVAVRSESITVHVVSEEKIKQLASGGNQVQLAMFCLSFGITITVVVTLLTNGLDQSLRPTFWMVFCGTILLSAYFGAMAIVENRRTRRLKRAILKETEKKLTPTY
jgi:hypothetical protein